MDIRYYLVKNGTDTAAKAPYTIRGVPTGVANLNDLVSEILTRISSSEQRVRMALTEAIPEPVVPGPVVTDTQADQSGPGESCKVTVTGSNLRFADGADPAEKVFFRDGDEGEEERESYEGYLEPPEINEGGTELTFRLAGGQWGSGDHTIHLRLEMVDAEGSPVSVDAGTFGFSGV